MTRVGSPEHLPHRPSWLCNSCERPWPCDPARETLATEYQHWTTGLFLYLAAQLVQALIDMPKAPVGELHEQFLSWVRRPATEKAPMRQWPVDPTAAVSALRAEHPCWDIDYQPVPRAAVVRTSRRGRGARARVFRRPGVDCLGLAAGIEQYESRGVDFDDRPAR
jgi:hypothetical protein